MEVVYRFVASPWNPTQMDQSQTREVEYVKVEPQVAIRVIKFIPETVSNPPVLFVPGWITIIEKFLPIIKGLVDHNFPVYYIEFRDKKSSKIGKRMRVEDFSLDKYVHDLQMLVRHYSPDSNRFYLFGSSHGAGIIMRYLAQVHDPQYKPLKSILMIPAFNLKFHSWQKLIIRIPLQLKPFLVWVVETYLKLRFMNPDEPELAYQFSEKIYDLDIRKVQLSAIAIDRAGGLHLSSLLEDIDGDVMVVGANNDFMHPERIIHKIARRIRNAKYLNLISNKFTHNELMGNIASRYFNNLSFYPILPLAVQNANSTG